MDNIVFNFQEQGNKSDKNTMINLCKFIADRNVTYKSKRLGKNKEGKIGPLMKVFPDAIVRNYFMKNLNKLKNPPDQFINLSMRHKNIRHKNKKRLLHNIAHEKKFYQTKIKKTLFL